MGVIFLKFFFGYCNKTVGYSRLPWSYTQLPKSVKITWCIFSVTTILVWNAW